MAVTPSAKQQTSEEDGKMTGAAGRAGVRLRAWLISLALIPLLVYWVEYTEIVALGPDLAAMSLPMAVIFALLVLIPINLIVKRWKPSAALTQAELILIYAMNTIAVYISGIGMMQFLTPALVGWSKNATPENKWANWHRFVPKWAVPDASVIDAYYRGKSSIWKPEILTGWLGAILVWTGFIALLFGAMYCLSTLLRKQWVEREKLIFPIVQIPLDITQNGGDTPLWRNRLLWTGFAIPVVLETMAAIHFTAVPTFPYLPLKPEYSLQMETNITQPPWNAIGYTTLSFYPLVIGLTYLLSLDVSFSCWFFYLLTKLESVMATALGFRDPGAGPALSRMPYVGEQGVGAFIGLALFSLYFARPHLIQTWRKAIGKEPHLDDRDEPMSYRAAWAGLFVFSLGLVGFGVALGLSLPVCLLFWGIFFLLALTFTRIRAEAGLPWGQGPWGLAHGNLTGYAGTQSFGGQELTAFSFLRWMDADWRCLAQPAQMEAMKMAASASPRPMNARILTFALLVATVVGTLAAFLSCLHIYYHYGAGSALVNDWRTNQGRYPFDELQGWLNNPRPPDTSRIAAAGVGLGIVTLLSLLRTQFVWWPLHPIGYAVGNTDTMTWIWFATFLGWLAKWLTLRYGGVKIYRQALPFFLGLVLGDYAISGLIALYFLATGMPGYRTFPI